MFIERKISPTSGTVELWWAKDGPGAERTLVRKIADEQPLVTDSERGSREPGAICWAHGRTLGNIEIQSPELLNQFARKRAEDVTLPCDFVYAGKYRHGADRWWCRTHQSHWGIKSDLAALHASGVLRCSNYNQLMNYELHPYTVDLDEYAEVGVWCSLPAALSTAEISPRPPKIHVHVRDKPGARKRIDKDFAVVSTAYSTQVGLFGREDTIRVDITPPAAFDFVCALESGKELGCIDCSNCGHPHLDLGTFGKTPHRKHFCANCGRDSTWSKTAIISTPLKPLHDRTASNLSCLTANRVLNLDDHKGHSYTVWASTPAIVWTASRPQEFGIHVHVHDGMDRIIDDTFGEVILNGKLLVRNELLQAMIERAIV